jgi:hypothetical protein
VVNLVTFVEEYKTVKLLILSLSGIQSRVFILLVGGGGGISVR